MYGNWSPDNATSSSNIETSSSLHCHTKILIILLISVVVLGEPQMKMLAGN